MRAFPYHERDSVLHRLNPLTKFLPTLPVVVILTLVTDPVTPTALAALALGLLRLLGRVPAAVIWRSLRPVIVVAIGILWTTALFYQSQATDTSIFFRLGGFSLTTNAALYALSITLRVVAISTFSLLFVLTTDPLDFVRSLVQQWHLSYRLGYGVLAGYRFVPLLEGEFATIRAAHKVRGVSGRGGPVTQVRRLYGYAIPLLAISIRKAERVALAMDARAFGALPSRTYYRQLRFERRDYIFLVALALAIAGLLAGLAALGWLGQLNPFASSRLLSSG